MANDCERRFHQNMRACFTERAPDHATRNLQDPVYWYKHYLQEEQIIKLFQVEISILEAIRAHVIRFLDGVIAIGAERCKVLTMLQRPQPLKRTLSEITAFRYEQTGIVDSKADVF